MGADKAVISGRKFQADFGEYLFELHFESEKLLTFTSLQGDAKGYSETVSITMTEIRQNVYMTYWTEKSGATVTHVEDFENGIVYTNITYPDLSFYNLKGTLMEKTGKLTTLFPYRCQWNK